MAVLCKVMLVGGLLKKSVIESIGGMIDWEKKIFLGQIKREQYMWLLENSDCGGIDKLSKCIGKSKKLFVHSAGDMCFIGKNENCLMVEWWGSKGSWEE